MTQELATGLGGRPANVNKDGYGIFGAHPTYGGGVLIETIYEKLTFDPLPNLILQINDIKTHFNEHVDLEGSVHDTDLSGDIVATADASDLATAITLANAMKTAMTTHLAKGAAAGHANGADTANGTAAADATTLATLVTLVEELAVDYEAHRVLITTEAHVAADSASVLVESDYAGETCATAIFPAGSVPLGVNSYVERTMATAVNFDLGVSGDLTRFASNELDTAGKVDSNPSDAWDRVSSATPLVVTPDVTPSDDQGIIHVQIVYHKMRAMHAAL
jgi:hypothetical protein